jgi:ADP-heptose:LPS heptosyltransferase
MSAAGKFEAPPEILFVTATRIGDAVLSTGVLANLLERYPSARFTVAAGPVAAPLFRGLPRLERLIAMPKRAYSRHWLDLYRHVVGTRWRLVVDLRGSMLPWLVMARERWSAGKGGPNQHRLEQLAAAFRLNPVPTPTLWLRPEDEAASLRLVPPGGAVLGIAPTANWPGKTWRIDRFVELLRRLSASTGPFSGARIAIIASPHERDLARPLLDNVPPNRRIDMTRTSWRLPLRSDGCNW